MKKIFVLLLSLMLCVAVFSVTINVLAEDSQLNKTVEKMIPEFEKATGIKVNFELVSSYNCLEKTALGVSLDKTVYDLVTVDEGNIAMFAKLMSSFYDWPEGKVYPKVNPSDFPKPIFEASLWDGDIVGIPYNANLYAWMTRTDVLEDVNLQKEFKAQYGYELMVPKTLQQLLEIGGFLKEKGVCAGWAPFTKSTEGATCEAIWIFESFGTNVLEYKNGKFNVILDKAKAVEAINFYKKLMAIAPEGAADFGHAERLAAFQMGDVFSMFIWPAQIPPMEDPTQTVAAGHIVYSAPPAGPARSAAIRGVWTLTIPKASQNIAAAAEFAYWMTSYKAGKESLVKAGMSPARIDLLMDAELNKVSPWFKGMFESMNVAVNRPRFEKYPEVSDRIKLHWLAAITGKLEPEAAVDNIIKDVKEILAKYGY